MRPTRTCSWACGPLSAELRRVAKDDLSRYQPAPTDGPPSLTANLAFPPQHPTALALVDQLREAGWETLQHANVYELVIALARAPDRFAAAVLAVDFCNREELRFFTLARRRWPALRTAAVTRPAFAFKAAMADLAGADFVCTDPARATAVLAWLEGRTPPPAMERPPRAEQLPPERAELAPSTTEVAAIPEEEPEETPSADEQSALLAAEETEQPSPRKPPGRRPAPPPQPVDSDVPAGDATDARQQPPPAPRREPFSARDILTEEEIAALLQDLDEDEEQK